MPDAHRTPAVGSREPVRLRCPRCGWAITLRTRWMTLSHCPRCVARRHVTVQLSGSPQAPLREER